MTAVHVARVYGIILNLHARITDLLLIIIEAIYTNDAVIAKIIGNLQKKIILN